MLPNGQRVFFHDKSGQGQIKAYEDGQYRVEYNGNLLICRVYEIIVKCGRLACESKLANCQHSQTGIYYCRSCAIRINATAPGLVQIP